MGRRPRKATAYQVRPSNSPSSDSPERLLSIQVVSDSQLATSGAGYAISSSIIQSLPAAQKSALYLGSPQQTAQHVSAQLQQPTSSTQKILLPKLPPGVKPPSKIIMIKAGGQSGQPKIHILNTARSSVSETDVERKRKMLTGELNVRNILPRPDPFAVRRRPAGMFMGGESGNICIAQQGNVVTKVAIPRYKSPSSARRSHSLEKGSEAPVSMRIQSTHPVIRPIDDDTDAVDGFADSEEEEKYLPLEDDEDVERDEDIPSTSAQPNFSATSTTSSFPLYRVVQQRTILPKIAEENQGYGDPKESVLLVNMQSVPLFASHMDEGSGQMVIGNLVGNGSSPNPDDFRPPKRRKLLKKELESENPESGFTITFLPDPWVEEGSDISASSVAATTDGALLYGDEDDVLHEDEDNDNVVSFEVAELADANNSDSSEYETIMVNIPKGCKLRFVPPKNNKSPPSPAPVTSLPAPPSPQSFSEPDVPAPKIFKNSKSKETSECPPRNSLLYAHTPKMLPNKPFAGGEVLPVTSLKTDGGTRVKIPRARGKNRLKKEYFEGKKCVNCACEQSPLWRTDSNGGYLCNACGLYYRIHGSSRPLVREKRVVTIKRVGSVCANCGTDKTTMWRRDGESKAVCNACGLYYRLHGIHRPITMKTEDIKTRNRKMSTKNQIRQPTSMAPLMEVRRPGPFKPKDIESKTNRWKFSARNQTAQPKSMVDLMAEYVRANPDKPRKKKASAVPVDSVAYTSVDPTDDEPVDPMDSLAICSVADVVVNPEICWSIKSSSTT